MNKPTVIVKVTGGQPKQIQAATVAEAKEILGLGNYSASVNKEPVTLEHVLTENDAVVFSESAKGASAYWELILALV